MTKRTQKSILASPEWKWWQESLKCVPDDDRRVYYRNRILQALVRYNDSSGFWREQAQLWRDKWEK